MLSWFIVVAKVRIFSFPPNVYSIKKAALCTRTTAYNRTPSGDFKIIGHPKMTCSGAENETRTRDPNLGKVVLYQLSYFRICFAIFQRTNGIVPFCECKGTAFFWTAKQIREKNAIFFDFLFMYPWIPYLWHIENLYCDLPCYGVHCLLYFAKLEVWLYFKCVKYNNNAEKA